MSRWFTPLLLLFVFLLLLWFPFSSCWVNNLSFFVFVDLLHWFYNTASSISLMLPSLLSSTLLALLKSLWHSSTFSRPAYSGGDGSINALRRTSGCVTERRDEERNSWMLFDRRVAASTGAMLDINIVKSSCESCPNRQHVRLLERVLLSYLWSFCAVDILFVALCSLLFSSLLAFSSLLSLITNCESKPLLAAQCCTNS